MSWLPDIPRTMEKVCPEPQGLEDDDDDDDNDDKFSHPYHSARPPPQRKSYDSSGDRHVEDLEEPIPFPLSPRHSYLVKEEGMKNRIYAKRLAKHALELEEEAQKFQEPFYKGTEMPGSLSEDEDHSLAYDFPVHQQSHVLQTAPCGSYDSFQCSTGEQLGMDAFASWAHARDPYLGYPEPHMLHKEAIGDSEFPSMQLALDTLRENAMLREENTRLRREVRSTQRSLESQACTVQRLEKQLKASLAKKEREAQELQSFVQWTEQSLQLMTQRALEAESNVDKLKQEILILQGELETSKTENKNLRAGQTTNLGAVKHNIDFSLQKLHKIIMGANWCIRQLTSGAESLNFVAEILKSTGKISEAEAEEQ